MQTRYIEQTQAKRLYASRYFHREKPHSLDQGRAANGTRTRDFRLGKPTLYQLSYCRKKIFKKKSTASLEKSKTEKGWWKAVKKTH